MSSPIQPVSGPQGPATQSAVDVGLQTFLSELVRTEDAHAIHAVSAGPPEELLAELARAAHRHDQLTRDGTSVAFGLVEGGGVRAELGDGDGTVRPISVAEAIALACAGGED
jgi:hypothetical protein